jgi:hypothetical protein
MSSALPPSFTFEMLSKLPPNSYVVQWREQRPDVDPVISGAQGSLGQKLRYSFSIRGAPNEFLLNTNCYLSGNSYLRVVADASGVDPVYAGDEAIQSFIRDPSAVLKPAYSFIASSRESFNSGALPLLDNQDSVRGFEHNTIRKWCTRRNTNRDGRINDISGLSGHSLTGNTAQIQGYALGGARLLVQTAASAWLPLCTGNDYAFQIPLGLYSSVVNSHSIIPIGLFSSYAVNGWKIDLETAYQVKTPKGTANNGRCWYNRADMTGMADSQIEADGVLSNLRLYYAVIKVLDQATMSAVLALYEKQEMVNVGGVQFPLSLRLNTINYRTFSFPIQTTQSDYMFRLSGTDRSVRAVAFKIFRTDDNANGVPFTSSSFRVARIETHIGSEMPHDVVEDTTTTTNNVTNFLNINARHSASVFSSLPYYLEGNPLGGQQEDDYTPVTFSPQRLQATVDNDAHSYQPVQYGVISLENLDRREGDYSGRFQACGKDLTNVGAIEIRMRILQCASAVATSTKPVDYLDTGAYSLTAPTDNNVQIVFMYAYDTIMEVSPQGVMDISSSVL